MAEEIEEIRSDVFLVGFGAFPMIGSSLDYLAYHQWRRTLLFFDDNGDE